MTTSGDPSDIATDLFRLKQCPECGYSLAALPLEGVCPECGAAYGTDVIILTGQPRGGHENLANGRPWKIATWLMLILPLLYISSSHNRSAEAYLFDVSIGLPAVVLLGRRFFNGVEPSQVRITPTSIMQIDSTHKSSAFDVLLKVLHGAIIAYFVALVAIGVQGAAGYLYLGFFGLILVGCAMLRRKHPMERRRIQWADALNLHLKPLRSGRYWMRTEPYWESADQSISIQLELTDEQVADLKLRIDGWKLIAHRRAQAARGLQFQKSDDTATAAVA